MESGRSIAMSSEAILTDWDGRPADPMVGSWYCFFVPLVKMFGTQSGTGAMNVASGKRNPGYHSRRRRSRNRAGAFSLRRTLHQWLKHSHGRFTAPRQSDVTGLPVEAFDEDGGWELAIFSGSRARVRAGIFAGAFYGSYRVEEALPEPLCYQLKERNGVQHRP